MYIYFQGCMQGYTGVNCSSSYPYPYYGVDCLRACKCSITLCDVSTGCKSLTTGKQFEEKKLGCKPVPGIVKLHFIQR